VLREARQADAAPLLRWRNDPAAVSASRESRRVEPSEHARWLERVLADPDRHLLLAERGCKPVGQVRFDRVRGYWYEVSVSVERQSRAEGIGNALVAAAVDWLWQNTNATAIDAWVRAENERSLRTFEGSGFRELPGEHDDVFRLLRLERPDPWAAVLRR